MEEAMARAVDIGEADVSYIILVVFDKTQFCYCVEVYGVTEVMTFSLR